MSVGAYQQPILIVDDEEEVLESIELVLNAGGYENVLSCQDSRKVLSLLKKHPDVQLILLDLVMPHLKGEDLLPILREQHSEIPVIVVTAIDDCHIAVDCMKSGAFDYVVKPIEKMRLLANVRHAVENREIARENRALKERLLYETLEYPEAFEPIVTRNKTMMSIFQYVEAIAPSPEPVLIVGETGVGKELIVNAIHKICGRKGPLVSVNIAGLDDTLFSDTLFGHHRGAFTGTTTNREGLVQTASGGTLFLDEIGDLTPASQIKLLRLIQENEYYPLGTDIPRKSDIRILAASNKNFDGKDASLKLRRDLYFRLQTHKITVPPLRERREDIPLLVDHFIRKAAKRLNKNVPGYPGQLIDILNCYDFPGNVRELESMVFDAVSKHRSRMLSIESFKNRIFKPGSRDGWNDTEEKKDAIFSPLEILPTLEESRKMLIEEALIRSSGNQSIAARFLGISQPALSRWLKSNS